MPDPILATDPFTQGYDAIQAAWAAWAPLMALVRPGNRPNLDAAVPTIKPQIRPGGDTPELNLRQRTFGLDGWADSLNASVFQDYDFLIVSGQRRLPPMNTVLWEVFRALVKKGPDLGVPALVQKWTIRGGSDSETRPLPNSSTLQWTALGSIHVMFTVRRATLLIP